MGEIATGSILEQVVSSAPLEENGDHCSIDYSMLRVSRELEDALPFTAPRFEMGSPSLPMLVVEEIKNPLRHLVRMENLGPSGAKDFRISITPVPLS